MPSPVTHGYILGMPANKEWHPPVAHFRLATPGEGFGDTPCGIPREAFSRTAGYQRAEGEQGPSWVFFPEFVTCEFCRAKVCP